MPAPSAGRQTVIFEVDRVSSKNYTTTRWWEILELKQTEVFEKWETSVSDKKVRAIIAARLYRLANGLAGDVQSVGEGIGELRVHYGAGYRIYFKKVGKAIILLLCGGDKSTQKQDIKLAKELAREV